MKQAAAFGGGAAIAAIAITAAEAGEWLTVIERLAASPAWPLVLGLIVVAGGLWVLSSQRASNAACEARVEELTRAVQNMYALLATDDRYPDLPPYEDFAAGKFNLHALHRARSSVTAPAFHRQP